MKKRKKVRILFQGRFSNQLLSQVKKKAYDSTIKGILMPLHVVLKSELVDRVNIEVWRQYSET